MLKLLLLVVAVSGQSGNTFRGGSEDLIGSDSSSGSGSGSGSECECPTDVMHCPNGAIVDRDPDNNCNFRPCPTVVTTSTPTSTRTSTPTSTSTPTTSWDPTNAYSLTAQITGTFTSISGAIRQNGNLSGDFLPLNFSILEDQLAITGTLRAVLSRTTRRFRQVTRNVESPLTLLVALGDLADSNPGRRRLLQVVPTLPTQPQVIPTGTPTGTGTTTPTQAPGTCNVLHLALQGVTDLDLLGLLVHLEPTFLDVTANPVGGLLGSLLCTVSGLLNGLGPLSDLLGGASGLTQGANLLNSVLGLLNLANSTQGLQGLEPVTGLLNSIIGVLNLGS